MKASKLIEKIKNFINEMIQSLDKNGLTPNNIKCIVHKVNEILNYLQHNSKENK